MNNKTIRTALSNLEKFQNKEENRSKELQQTIGITQSQDIYPSIVGFKRSVLHILLKLVMPVSFAAILVFVDTVWVAFVLVIVLF
jgi:hypothetical protein